MEFPALFCKRMEALLGEETPRFFAALEKEPVRALRFDPKKVSEEEIFSSLGEDLGERIPFGQCAFRFTAPHIGSHPLHHGGAVYVQEPAAMAPVFALGEREFDSILDLCAAPGGKSLQAAATCLSEKGILFCNEPVSSRLKVLMQNLERCSERRAVVTSFDATSLPTELAARFDLVICDVPCSGEGMMRKNSQALSQWSEENILASASRQKKILESAAEAVKPGGVILYSTCTWAVEENEEILTQFLACHEDFSLESASDAVVAASAPGVGEGMEKARRFYPHIFPGEGQFLAILKKAGEGERACERRKKEKGGRVAKIPPEIELGRAFLKEALTRVPEGEVVLRGEDLYFVMKKAAPLPPSTVSCGVLMGQVRKGRVIPHHRFFMAFYDQMEAVQLSKTAAEAYLRGEEISLSGKDGWRVAKLFSCPLGGVKAVGGRGKNYYPKGLRKADICTTN